ncbi:enhancer of mRNA-decapping protein 4 isoform X1 [Hemiscyllium ocellatum]|uniref:enhancer of mRNA-decapping protein 4 isoform X1 n=1 Tax=Hemiscyllium ocellatum TaxID=170820 RepID=UPI0029661D7B|nr:enhancer of mRNA-decapping protein 4 isoform X1 [Hemiscyllium ocellatum]
MASPPSPASKMDIENATQHLRDMLKLDRVSESTIDKQKKSASYNGELNGLLVPDPIAAGDGPILRESNSANLDKLNLQQNQEIYLTGDDSSNCVITAKEVEIVASNDSSISNKARGSNKVKIQPVAKYEWEQKYYYGNLIAVSNQYLAYVIRGANGVGMVRVLSVGMAERTLLKGFTEGVADLGFAHLNSNQLACVDEAGNLFVWQLNEENGKIQEKLIVHIKRPEGTPLNANRRVIWCPFIPEENDENDEGNQTLAVLHEDRAEVWDLDILRNSNNVWPIEATDIKEGFIIVKGHTARISEGALSPDGTVLATASHDGYVKFWQIYIEGQDQPRCLHEWKPHDGRPLSCLLFCDNHKKQDPDVPFWRFLITGADQNRELKMWCTVSWTCLQTIRFMPDPFNTNVYPSLKASLDLSAEYLILSDVQRKVLYVMELHQNQDEGKAHFVSISEFLLTHPVLSFGIQDVSRCRPRHIEVLSAEEESDTLNAEGTPGLVESSIVQLKLYCVHTKTLQDVQIYFQPHQNTEEPVLMSSAASHEDFTFADRLTDVSVEGPTSEKGSSRDSQHDLRRIVDLPVPTDFLSVSNDVKPKLMTPDAFMTPSTSLQQISVSPGSSVSTLTAVTGLSNSSANETGSSRPAEDLCLSPKVTLENVNLSNNTSNTVQASPRNNSVQLIPGLSEQLSTKPLQVVGANSSLPLELQSVDPLCVPQSSPTRERSPDVISSASTALSQDIPEIASETLQRAFSSSVLPTEVLEPTHHMDSMASAASALHLLSPRSRPNSEHSHHSLDMPQVEVERLSTPSLLETVLSQENTAADNVVSQPWPAAPDITRETRNSINESSREDMQEKHKNSAFHRHPYQLHQHDSQDASAEQSDHDDEVASLASTSCSFGSKSASHRLPVKDWKSKTSPRSSPKLRRKSKKDDGETAQSPRLEQQQQFNTDQEELLSLLRSQQRELSELRQSQLELMQRLTDHMDAVQGSIMGHVERIMVTQQEQEQRRMDRILAEGHERNGQFQEQLSHQLSQNLANSISNRIEKTVRDEMKKTLPQSISKSLEPVSGQLNNHIATKLAAIEGILKENITKMVKSKNTVESIGRAAADALQGPIQSSYRESFQSIVVPVFEKACQSMFQQINDSFKQGTQEYIQQLEIHLQSKKTQEQEIRDPLISQLQQMIDRFQSVTDHLAATITNGMRSEVQHQLHIIVSNLQESILTQVQRIVKGEVSLAMKEQQAVVTSSIMQAMRSAAGTPIPTTHMDFQSQQAHILQLLQQGQLNQAFQQALTAADLNLVLYVCETVDSQLVFGQHPCPLTQPVLLSLIQQLSTDLNSRTELKLSYLEDAVMNLDHTDPVARDHMGSVLNQVRQKLYQFNQAEPHSNLSKRARRLMMMLQGLVTPLS